MFPESTLIHSTQKAVNLLNIPVAAIRKEPTNTLNSRKHGKIYTVKVERIFLFLRK